MQILIEQFDLRDQVAVVTGGGGVLCGAISRALGRAGVQVAVLNRSPESACRVADDIVAAGGQAIPVQCDVLDQAALDAARDRVHATFGRVDILINGVGGNRPEATATPDVSFFDLPAPALRGVLDLNLMGVLLPCQVFGRSIAEQGEGSILNISSMSAFRPLTRVSAYSAAKAAVSNFTQWLATYMSQTYSPRIRVNAIAPGFFLTKQNRYLLIDEQSGELTPRGRQILDHTPMGRFGAPDDLIGTVLWLLSPGARFVHGIVVPVDGGFSAYSGV